MDIPSASVLRLQTALPLLLIADMPQPRQAAGVNQIVAVAQQAGDCTTPDILHDVLLKEDIAPDAVFNIQPATGDVGVNVRMPIELSAVGVQGTEDTDLQALFAGPS